MKSERADDRKPAMGRIYYTAQPAALEVTSA